MAKAKAKVADAVTILLTRADLALVDRVARLTGAARVDVVRPVLGHLHVSSQGGTAQWVATDLDVYVRVVAGHIDGGAAPLLVPAYVIAALASVATDAAEIEIVLNGASGRARAGDAEIQFSTVGVDVDDFPAADLGNNGKIALSAADCMAIAAVSTAQSQETARYNLCGIWFDPAEGGAVVATDGNRLHMSPAPWAAALPAPVLVPVELAAVFAAMTAGAHLDVQAARIVLREDANGDLTAGAMVVDAAMPEWRTAISVAPGWSAVPGDRVATRVVADGAALVRALAWVAKADRNDVALHARADGVLIASGYAGSRVQIRVAARVECPASPISANPRYLAAAIEAVAASGDVEIAWWLDGAADPISVTAAVTAAAPAGASTVRAIVMPTRLGGSANAEADVG